MTEREFREQMGGVEFMQFQTHQWDYGVGKCLRCGFLVGGDWRGRLVCEGADDLPKTPISERGFGA